MVRLGHMTHATQEHLKMLADINLALKANGMPRVFVEMSLSSNVGTRALEGMAQKHGLAGLNDNTLLNLYPLLDMLLLDIPVLVSTDGAGVYNTSLATEQDRAISALNQHVETLMKQAKEPNANSAKDRLQALWKLTGETSEPPQNLQADTLATALFGRLLNAQHELLQTLGLAEVRR